MDYTMLIQIKTSELVDSNDFSSDGVRSEIQTINKLLGCATTDMEEFLQFMDYHPNLFEEKEKIMTLVYLGRLYRFYIVKNKIQMQEYLDKSVHFIRRFIQTLKKNNL